MSARKIRMTSVGLVAMPADRDESMVTGEHLATDPDLCTAWAEMHRYHVRNPAWPGPLVSAWQSALNAAARGDTNGLRAALTRARDAASAAGYSSEHEDAALAMLPPVAGRRAA